MTALLPRKQVLVALGITENMSRSSWSHDDGERIIFDAWIHRFDDRRYPMSTDKHYPRDHDYMRRGLTMWLAHLDLVIAGQREAILINPVPVDPWAQPCKGARGWLPRYITGKLEQDDQGWWFVPGVFVALNNEEAA